MTKTFAHLTRRRILFLSLFAVTAVLLLLAFDNRLLVRQYTVEAETFTAPIRIVLVTDLHSCDWGEGQSDLIRAIDEQNPDLILLGGDICSGCETEEQLRGFLEVLMAHTEERKIPWAHVYGNHDTERIGKDLTREEEQEIYESFPYCISKAGPVEIPGVGNYVLPVYSSDVGRRDPLFAVWGLDSGAYVRDPGLPGNQAIMPNALFLGQPKSDYAYIPFTQIQWYFNSSLMMEEYAGHKVPGLMYFHIPLQEFYTVYLNPEQTGMTGVMEEGEICAGVLNSGLFTAMLERGDIRAVCCGHDHCNDYAGTYCGICLAYAANIGYDTYHNEHMMGGRMFVIREEDPADVKTYMSYINRD